jgi:hypothetical protein
MRSILARLALCSSFALTSVVLAGCSCEFGFTRIMGGTNPLNQSEVPPNARFTVDADGYGVDPQALLAQSGVNEQTFFLEDSTGNKIPADVTVDSAPARSNCRNGVHFYLKPHKDLPLGTYTLVLLMGKVKWPSKDEAPTQHKGEPALVRTYKVVAS